MRVASIHLTEDKLIEALDWVMTQELYTSDDIARAIMKKYKPHSVKRGISISTKKLEAKVKKLLITDTTSVNIFQSVLMDIRKSKRHRVVYKINEGDPDWPILMKVARNANTFCNNFSLSQREGYIIYCKLALERLSRWSLGRAIFIDELINDIYSSEIELREDPSPDKTNIIYNRYVSLILSKTGMAPSLETKPEKYVYFMRAKEKAIELGVGLNDYMDAQFLGLEFTGSFPEPTQLIGDNAIQRLNKYLYLNKQKANNSPSSELKNSFEYILNR